MRRSLVGVLLVALAIVPSALPVTADDSAEVAQTVNGTIAAPTRFTDLEYGYAGLGRRLWLIAPQSNGLVSYTFPVDAASWGGAFEIKNVTDATGTPDLDIYFYRDLGNMPLLSTDSEACTLADYEVGGPGEKGFVPFGARKAIVFTPSAVNATFTYESRTMPTINIARDSLDMTVPFGAFVGWKNDTGDYSYVRHLPASTRDAPLFDSSPGVATGLRNGEVFNYQFDQPGKFRYETSTGIGTITVTDEGPGVGVPFTACS